MKAEPYIVRGPDFDGCTGYCDHQKALATLGIYWQTDDKVEWGFTVAVGLTAGKLGKVTQLGAEKILWNKYDEWEDLRL